MTIRPASDRSLLISFGEEISADAHRDVVRLTHALEGERAVLNLHPAFASVLIDFDPRRHTHEQIEDLARKRLVEAAAREAARRASPGREDVARHGLGEPDGALDLSTPPRTLEIPVRYGGSASPGREDAARHGLGGPEGALDLSAPRRSLEIPVRYGGSASPDREEVAKHGLGEPDGALDLSAAPRILEIPVRYGGSDGPDLEDVARHAGVSPERAVEIFSSAEYEVWFVGFATCFPYLGGLPPELATPRLPAPRKLVPAGSVAIGGAQAGAYPLPSPGGWRIVGRTALPLFDPAGEPPGLLRMGDRVRFLPV